MCAVLGGKRRAVEDAGLLCHGFAFLELLQVCWPGGIGMARLSLEAPDFCSNVEGILGCMACGEEFLWMVPTSPSKNNFPNDGSKAKEGASCSVRTTFCSGHTHHHSSSPKSGFLTTKVSLPIPGRSVCNTRYGVQV